MTFGALPISGDAQGSACFFWMDFTFPWLAAYETWLRGLRTEPRTHTAQEIEFESG